MRFLKWLYALVAVLGLPATAFAQGLDITRGQRGLVTVDIMEHLFVSTALGSGGAGLAGTVAAKDLTGEASGVTSTFTLTRTGTVGNAVAPPPYAGRIQFGVYDSGGASEVTCTAATIAGIDPYGQWAGETVTGTIDKTPATSPVLTTAAYSDVTKVTFTGCAITGETVGSVNLILKAVISDWIYLGQKVRSAKQIHKICGHDFDAAPAINSWDCHNGYQINTEKTWSDIFHARSNTLDMATLFTSDTQLFGGALETIHIETFPFPVSF